MACNGCRHLALRRVVLPRKRVTTVASAEAPGQRDPDVSGSEDGRPSDSVAVSGSLGGCVLGHLAVTVTPFSLQCSRWKGGTRLAGTGKSKWVGSGDRGNVRIGAGDGSEGGVMLHIHSLNRWY